MKQVAQINIDDNKYSWYKECHDFYNFEEGQLDYGHFISNDGRNDFLMEIGYVENFSIKNDRM